MTKATAHRRPSTRSFRDDQGTTTTGVAGSARHPPAAEVPGLPNTASIQVIRLADIDLKDTRFQFRLNAGIFDLKKSLLADGQQVPVILWGSRPPFVIVDGFRRIEAIASLGWTTVHAIVRDDIDENRAYSLGFIENVKRKNLSAWDKASAAWQAVHQRGLTKDQVAGMLELSPRQVERYLALLSFPEAIRKAIQTQRVSMAHAVVLHRSGVANWNHWMDEVRAEGLSAKQLKRRLRQQGQRGRPAVYMRRVNGGFRIYPMVFDAATDETKRVRMITCLEEALGVLRSRRDPSVLAARREAEASPPAGTRLHGARITTPGATPVP